MSFIFKGWFLKHFPGIKDLQMMNTFKFQK